tara:strand:- start:8079 stop:8261 length:183 start_codon:yes stop_codon:yes gene_type:complete
MLHVVKRQINLVNIKYFTKYLKNLKIFFSENQRDMNVLEFIKFEQEISSVKNYIKKLRDA